MSKAFRSVAFLCLFLFFAAGAFCATSQSSSGVTAQSCYKAGQEQQQLKNWYEAVECYLEATRINPSYGDAYFALSQCSCEMGEYQLALTYLDIASKYIRNRPELQNLRGFIYISLGMITEAKAQFEDVLKTFPNNVEARFGLAELEILDGRVAGAEKQFLQALQRQPADYKVLLSLALVSDSLGKTTNARDYVNRALQYYSGNAEVYYLAGYLAKKQGDLEIAEDYVRTAIKLDDVYDDAYRLLASILYETGRYEEVLELCSFRISLNRNAEDAWYLRGLSYAALNRVEEAFTALETGLEINPDDEIMRAELELLVCSNTRVEDPRRAQWAAYHLKKAREYAEKYFSVQAAYEYQRCLRLNPKDIDSRRAYADLMLTAGYPEAYLSHLEFIQNQGEGDIRTSDIIEGYRSLLYNTLSARWNVDPFYLDKSRWQVGLYYENPVSEGIHSDASKITSLTLGDVFSVSSAVTATADSSAVKNFTEAFQRARKKGFDYFCLIETVETERDITIMCNMYSGRTGNAAGKWTIYRTGNSRFSNAVQKLRQSILAAMPYYAKIIARSGADVLIDAGRMDGVANDQVWTVFEPESIRSADFGLGLTFAQKNILGTVCITNAGEDIAEGVYTQVGFYDRMNVGDTVLLIAHEEDTGSTDDGEAGTTTEDGVVVKQDAVSSEPELIKMLRVIR
ncbi:MAG: tetratricopeptide repeat protein [Spirochaetaceae bacterium]|nr:tetratricopeptide repeat protein [Spirochaetaceae bacterium]